MRFSATLYVVFLLFVGVVATPSRAQETVWVQVEAVPTLAIAQERARAYSGRFENVNGFRAGRWYAISLGPYSPEVARQELTALRRQGLIPSDAYIAQSSTYAQQFWPLGVNALGLPPVEPNTEVVLFPSEETATETPPEEEPVAETLPFVPDETPQEARASERLLTAEERRGLQEALQWFGYYTAAIDGAFGPGTRRAMQDWQAAQGYDATGVLTTAQRAEVLDAFRAPFEALGLRTVVNRDAGIEMTLPMSRVSLARTDAPFVQYDSSDGSGMRVLLISQAGDEATLFGLYDIMQTLEIVPPEGPRNREARRFSLRGESPDLKSQTIAQVEDGAVKGFTLIWQDEDARVIESVIETMEESFTFLEGVLPDTAREGDVAEQRIDLLSGLEIRKPERTRSGFYVDAGGTVLTTSEAVMACTRVTIGDSIEASVAAEDTALGLALLRPSRPLVPLAVARFQGDVPRLQSEIAVSGFSYGAVLELPLLTYGRLADLRGLQGEEELTRLELAALPGDAGGPVFDATGSVLGVLRASPEDQARVLPDGVAFATDVSAIAGFLGDAGLSPLATDASSAIPPEDLANLAADLTVPVNCWK